MKVFKTISDTRDYISSMRSDTKSLGLVPTMGALHKGHLSLVEKARKENDIVGVSIYVNPIQFNDPMDLKKYPRDMDSDLSLLAPLLKNDDFIFIPSTKEMYPETVKKEFDFGPMANVMEGAFRPGHFNGVGIVVERLFRIINPDNSYFGEKDFQQIAIIRRMAEIENLPVNIISCPIIRENNGLAMSSRNQRLDKKSREEAGIIYNAIMKSGKLNNSHTPEQTAGIITEMINSIPGFEVEYLIFADERNLVPVINWNEKEFIRCFSAVQVGPVRLIDNIKVEINK